jgi:hypothetical protein
MDQKAVTFELTSSQALVLFDFLSRFNAQDDKTFEDESERLVLSELECLLETKLPEPFEEGYSTLLREARCTIRKRYKDD